MKNSEAYVALQEQFNTLEEVAMNPELGYWQRKNLQKLMLACSNEMTEMEEKALVASSAAYKPISDALKASTKQLEWAKNKVHKMIKDMEKAAKLAAWITKVLLLL